MVLTPEERRAWRQARPEYRANQKALNAAARKAVSRLKRAHPVEYRLYYEEEVEAAGGVLRPVGRPAGSVPTR